MPSWVKQGYEEYAVRLPHECRLNLVEISPAKRTKNADIVRIIQREGEKMLDAIPSGSHVIAMEVKGKSWSTEDLSSQMKSWMLSGKDIALLIGGPEGLSQACRERADQLWSLSALTLPHPMVRVLLAEQLYRSWSILKNMPYHR